MPAKGGGDQGGNADGERGPGEGHPVGRRHPVDAIVGEAVRQGEIHDQSGRDSDDPACHVQADAAGSNRPGDRRDQQQLRDEPRHRACVRRSHRPSRVPRRARRPRRRRYALRRA